MFTGDIYPLSFYLNNPITLQSGIYWFSYGATAVPEPDTMAFTVSELVALA
jgi:hypothetical protein